MAFRAALDFGSPLPLAPGLYRLADAGAHFGVLPGSLTAATLAGGLPDLSLELIRGPNPMVAPQPYGILDARFLPAWRVDEALAAARAAEPLAVVDAVPPLRGWLRLIAAGDVLLPPTAFQGSAWGEFRVQARLDQLAAALLAGAIRQHTLLLVAVAELVYRGVAARVAACVQFNPAAVMAALNRRACAGIITREAIVSYFASLPPELTVNGSAPPVLLGEAIADRLISRFTSLVPAAAPPYSQTVHLQPASAGSFEWDLRDSVLVERAFPIVFDALGVVAQERAQLVRETVSAPLASGFRLVEVSANLPADRPGVLSCGVHLRAPARLPARPQPLSETVELTPPAHRARALMRFAPGEAPRFRSQTFLILETGDGFHQLLGPERDVEGDDLRLTVDDFPVSFLEVGISPQLAELAAVELSALWSNGQTTKISFSQSRRIRTLVGPRGDAPRLQWVARRGEQCLELDGGQWLDLPRFAAYGTHTVTVEVVFAPADPPLLALELQPEAAAASPVTLAFTPARPCRDWTWFAASPFEPGFCWRLFDPAHPRPWSQPVPPGAPLRLSARQLIGDQT
jgi:hypothetical protein